jgi:hypothetical protein
VKKGELQASSLSAAQDALHGMGFQIRSLKPAPLIELSDKPKESKRPALEYRPPLHTKLGLGNVPSQLQLAIAGLFALLGFALLIGGWKETGSRTSQKTSDGRARYAIEVRGELEESQANDTEIVVRFPEVPLRKQFHAKDLLDSKGSFKAGFEFSSTRRPTRCEVSVRRDGYEPLFFPDLSLQGEPLTANVPPLRFKASY